jgi:hypothetical protein
MSVSARMAERITSGSAAVVLLSSIVTCNVSHSYAGPSCLRGPYREDDSYQNWFVDNHCGGSVKIIYRVEGADSSGDSASASPDPCADHVPILQTSLSAKVTFEVVLDSVANSTTCISRGGSDKTDRRGQDRSTPPPAAKSPSGAGSNDLARLIEAAKRRAEGAASKIEQQKDQMRRDEESGVAHRSAEIRNEKRRCAELHASCNRTCQISESDQNFNLGPRLAACQRECDLFESGLQCEARINGDFEAWTELESQRLDVQRERQRQQDITALMELRAQQAQQAQIDAQSYDAPVYVPPSGGGAPDRRVAPTYTAPPMRSYTPPTPPRGGGAIYGTAHQ